MATKILGNSAYTTITDFGNCSFLNTTGTFSKADGIISVNVTGIKSEGTSTSRGFYFAPGAARRMNYSMDIRFVSSEGASSATIPKFGWEQATTRSITLTSEWQTFTGTFVRSKQESYAALVFYVNGTTFPLGTYYIRNIYLERMSWIFTFGGVPLKITV